ncbi:hypothetical protein [Wuhan insect virus 8]|uniref:hypothetical protein n=1 Tax=Wuhan insect virus 8 TaxID=1923739 RepID=UPI00090B5294|nr:hypothetical protein [Wuhan insect virus 8]APG77765.1 hypothetical protein [Wuhan insect virus 8]
MASSESNIGKRSGNRAARRSRNLPRNSTVPAVVDELTPEVSGVLRSGSGRRNVNGIKSKNKSYDFNQVFSDIALTLTSAISNPLVLLTIALSVGVITTHNFPQNKGFIYDTFREKNDTISRWVVDNGQKVAGFSIFLPAVVDSPRNFRSVIALTSFLWVMVIPESSVVEYFLQALAVHTYFRLKTDNSRLTLLAIIGIAWFLGYFHIPTTK